MKVAYVRLVTLRMLYSYDIYDKSCTFPLVSVMRAGISKIELHHIENPDWLISCFYGNQFLIDKLMTDI